MNEPQPIQFSIRWLLIATAVVAILIAVLMHLGERGGELLILAVALATLIHTIYTVQRFAVPKEKLLHFWQATFAYVIFLPLMWRSRRIWMESGAIVDSIILGLGLMLSVVALLRGNWVTRIYVSPIALIYAMIVILAVRYSDWNFIWNYWLEPEFY